MTDPTPDLTDTVFPFTLTGQDPFTLTNGDPNYNTGFSLVPGLDYVAEQSEVAGWEPTVPTCSSALGTSSFNETLLSATISLAPGDTVTCEFNNIKQFTMIVLVCEESTNKLYASLVTIPGGGGAVTISLGPNEALLDPGLKDEQLCSLAVSMQDHGDLYEILQLH